MSQKQPGSAIERVLLQKLALEKLIFDSATTQSEPSLKQEDKLSLTHIGYVSSLLFLNSAVLVGASFYKQGLCGKSLAVLAGALYLNLSWNFYMEGRLVEAKVRGNNSLLGHWYRHYFNANLWPLGETAAGTRFRQLYLEPVGASIL